MSSTDPPANTIPLSQEKPDDESYRKITEEMYKQNLELSIRNKTLAVLRTLYAITMASLNVKEVAQRIVDAIVKELNFSAALISLVDSTNKILRPIAITQSPRIIEAFRSIGKAFDDITIPLDYRSNLAINVLQDREREVTGNLLDILVPHITQEEADYIQNIAHINILIIYPILLGEKGLGVLTIAIGKKVDDLSRAERETLEQLMGVVGIAIDRAQLHEDLQHANDKLKELDKLKDEFLSVASHELRTPMTAVKSYTWMVLNGRAGPIEPKAREYLDLVYSSTQRLIHLVGDMLDVSRIESGRVQLRLESFDIYELVFEIRDEFRARAVERGLSLEVVSAQKLPPVFADREKVFQVFENLVGNAIKFTPRGGKITISLSEDINFIKTDIIDTGKGIPEEEIPKLFTKFGRLDSSLSSILSEPGTGLGLYISKQYIELNKGRIWVKSTVGKGSTFSFTLPLAKSDATSSLQSEKPVVN